MGTIIFHGATVNASAKVGMCNIVNSHALIEHNAYTGNFCHISTGAIINGSAKIGDRSFIGSRSVIVNDVVIANETFVKAGSIVKRDA
jgi:UDP-3-O-[3-hydroxymyristoyl] glucosamine N-acyltransferase